MGVTYFTPLYRYIAVPTDESDQFIHEYPLHNVVPFSINENGDMAVVCYQNPNGVASVINVDTGEQGYCGIGYLTNTGLNPSGLSIPRNIALADSGEIYVLCNEDKGDYLEFREAMRLFQLGRRDDAAKALERLASEGKDDYVSAMYLEYIRSLSADDKSNIFRFVRK